MITYLYEYREGVRAGSAGYLKLDSKGSECRVQLHLQGRYAGEEQGMVYFVVKPERTKGVLLGEAQSRAGADSSWVVNRDQICGSPFSFADVEGMAVLYPSGKYLASCWIEEPDEEFLYGSFEAWQPEAEGTEQPQPGAEEVEQPQPGAEEVEQPQPKAEEAEALEPQTEETTAEEIHVTEVAPELPPTAVKEFTQPRPADNAAERKEAVQPRPADNGEERKEAVQPQPADGAEERKKAVQPLTADCTMERMDISDIRKLPKKNWHLCSNSFLIHGFFNYHYLVLKRVGRKEQEKLYLGVPGVYARAERAMALLFGFPDFEEMDAPEGKTGEEQEVAEDNVGKQQEIAEDNVGKQQKITEEHAVKRQEIPQGRAGEGHEIPEGSFGYWYCQLDR